MTNEQLKDVLANLKDQVICESQRFKKAIDALDYTTYRHNIGYIDDIMYAFDDILFAGQMLMESLDEKFE